MSQTTQRPWYRESTLLIVAGVLVATFCSGAAMLTLALSGDDQLVISEQEYQQLRDDLRVTKSRTRDDDE